MNPATIGYLEFYMSILTFTLFAVRYVVPVMRDLPFARAVAPVLLLHSLRHIGMMYLISPGVVPEVPSGFAAPTAYGDLIAALLALLAFGALRLSPSLGKALVWLFNVEGFLDLGIAAANANRFQLATHSIGPAYLLPAIVVPALIVTHGLVFWLLLRRAPLAVGARRLDPAPAAP